MKIIYFDNGIGWQPILHMVKLMSEYYNADLQVIKNEEYKYENSSFKKLSWCLKRYKKGEDCLIIVPSACEIEILFTHDKNWRNKFGKVAVYVIDSFWTDRIRWFSKYLTHIDHYFVTSPEDAEIWAKSTKVPVSSIPWGSDVLKLGWQKETKDIDLLRLGRQPPEWDDDAISNTICSKNNIKFHGRPPSVQDPLETHMLTMRFMKRSKFILSFSNVVDSSPYTHPSKEYITGRWTDALASGAVVVGTTPKCRNVRDLFWNTAILNIQSTSQVAIVDGVLEALHTWNKDLATTNKINALENLDWRWRFKEISNVFGLSINKLDSDLIKIEKIISEHKNYLQDGSNYL